jgi:hypothetical protein
MILWPLLEFPQDLLRTKDHVRSFGPYTEKPRTWKEKPHQTVIFSADSGGFSGWLTSHRSRTKKKVS